MQSFATKSNFISAGASPKQNAAPARQGARTAIRQILNAGVQPKLKIGAVNDPVELEADRVAEQVMRMPAPESETDSAPPPIASGEGGKGPAVINRKCAECGDEEKVQRKADTNIQHPVIRMKGTGSGGGETNAATQSAINNLGAGTPLPKSERAFFEPRFGRDLSGIRVHTDGTADAASRAINARAFSLGNNIAFASGEYQPDTHSGRTLMAHELTHTLQGGTGVRRKEEFECNLTGVIANSKLTAGVGNTTRKGSNLVLDIIKVQHFLLEAGYFSYDDNYMEGVTFVWKKKCDEHLKPKDIPRTITAIKLFQATALYRSKSDGVISSSGKDYKFLLAIVGSKSNFDRKAIDKELKTTGVKDLFAAKFSIDGAVGNTDGGNKVANLTAVQGKLNKLTYYYKRKNMNFLSNANLAKETPSKIFTANAKEYGKGLKSVKKKHIPETIASIKKFQTLKKYSHKFWNSRSYRGEDLSSKKYTSGIVKPGDLSEFILTNASAYQISYKDDAGKDHKQTQRDFTRSNYTKYGEGVSITGNAKVTSFTDAEFKAFGLTDTEIKGLKFVSKNEGTFNAINSYDKAYFSYGFIQMAGGGRSFHKFLRALKRDNKTIFDKYFGKYGVDVVYDPESKRFATAVMNTSDGTVLFGNDAEKHIKNDPRFLGVFMKAGHNKNVQSAQLSVATEEYVKPMRTKKFGKTSAISVIKFTAGKKETVYVGDAARAFSKEASYMEAKKKGNITETTFNITGEKISTYWSSAKSITAMIDRCIHQGENGARSLFTKASVKFINKEKITSLGALKTASESKFMDVLKDTLGDTISDKSAANNAKARIQKIINNAALLW